MWNVRTVQNKELPTEIKEVLIDTNDDEEFVNEDLLVSLNLATSKSEAKRLFQQGGVEVDGKKIIDPNTQIVLHDGMIVKVGKRNIVRLKI